MNNINISSVGEIIQAEDGFAVKLKDRYKSGLAELDGFSHIDVVWWAHLFEEMKHRNRIVIDKPYVKGPDKIGVFATRSQIRPNPIAITPVYVIRIDHEKGIVHTPYIDAEPGSPVLDIKPYSPCTNITRQASVPDWCRHWPDSLEGSATFDWTKEFTFE